jgi:putative aldouronate transport system permease protein
MYGVTLAFKDFSISKGILGSPWVGFKHFQKLFAGYDFYQILSNTLRISILKILIGFPVPIILALLLNEIYKKNFKKVVQTISYLPHFISWVILGGLIIEMLSPSRGVVNYILTLFGTKPIYFLTSPEWFVPIVIITHVWQSAGWSSVIYLAAIAGIDAEQYESAYIDGATRYQRVKYITVPSIMPTIAILFILGLGNILNAGFDQIFNLYNPSIYSVADIFDTYVYRTGLANMQYSFTTAIGLFKNGIGMILILGANYLVKRFGNKDYGVW